MSKTFEAVRGAVKNGMVRVSQHAIREIAEDDLALDTVLDATLDGDAIEDYPEDPRGASCLAFCWVDSRSPVHVVWGYDAASGLAVMITVYRPKPGKWEDDFKTRRR